jgi:hypothetical protein
MVDVVRGVFVVAALVASLRAGYRAGVLVAVAVLVVIAGEVALLFTLPAGPMPAELAFGAIFLGPTALAPIDPLHHLGVAALGTYGARRAFSESAPLHPEVRRAKELDRAGLRHLAIAVLHALLSLSGVLARGLGA